MNFGQKLRQLRIKKGLTQQKPTEKLGYKTNSYISDVESGCFISSKEKLKMIAKALGVSFMVLDGMLLESRLESLGIKVPELTSLFKNIPSLPERDRRAIINAHLKIKNRRGKIMKHKIEKANEIRENMRLMTLNFWHRSLGLKLLGCPWGG